MMRVLLLVIALLLAGHDPGRAQTVSGVRGLDGGVGVLFSLVGPGTMYIDGQGTQGFIYPNGTFESFMFRNPMSGQFWTGALMTLGPQLTVGLIQGANQTGTPTVFPPPPRLLPPLPPVQSTLFDGSLLSEIP